MFGRASQCESAGQREQRRLLPLNKSSVETGLGPPSFICMRVAEYVSPTLMSFEISVVGSDVNARTKTRLPPRHHDAGQWVNVSEGVSGGENKILAEFAAQRRQPGGVFGAFRAFGHHGRFRSCARAMME